MSISKSLLPEFDLEMANTRKTLERVPDGKLTWKPHPKSGTMGWLAGHLANLPAWATLTIQQDSLDLSPDGAPPKPQPEPKSQKELLATFDKNLAEARAALAGADDATLLKPWSLLRTRQTLMTMPKVAVLRGFVINHIIHHRAGLASTCA